MKFLTKSKLHKCNHTLWGKKHIFKIPPLSPQNNVEDSMETLNLNSVMGEGESESKYVLCESPSLKNFHKFLHLNV